MTGSHLWEADTLRPTWACGEGGSWERMGRLSHVVGVLSLVPPLHRCGGAPSEGGLIVQLSPCALCRQSSLGGEPEAAA